MRRVIAGLMVVLPLATGVACSGAAPEPVTPPTTSSAAPTDTAPAEGDAGAETDNGAFDASTLHPVEDAGSDASAAQGPSACADGMVLVEGDYCTDVEQKCLKSWFDKSNKKKVCEEFEPKSTCVGSKIKKRFCIDMYSWPNVKGERPEVMNNFYQAQVKCAAMGKRMCTESEWTMACEGPEMKPFPYGYKRDATKCNGDHKWDGPDMSKVARRDPKELARLWKGVPSGSQPECVSDYGVADLPANNDEVVANEHTHGGFEDKFASVNTGGPWYKGVRNQCRPKIYTHDEGFYYYYLGFRCCAAPDGAANEPLTPHQIRDKWKFDRVERLARFTTEEMQEKLKLKAEGKCSCKASDNLCKTMCGTLLGPNAKDVDLKAPREP
ncbi:MAG: SUMF1/EgtB/PvdO family nonheme iron enzyme [Polyangiaceae bacterium]|nr:SUMF1/EgtB/PvdO family nonheme iron enzyme [Polyangiaceae bacterium]MCB9605676.1 SUMF1/EgtB/PvdO family nonheme iron enzyme [Polyangiaceae bacterium]